MGLENPTCRAEVGETGDISYAMLGELAAGAFGQAGNSAEVARSFGAWPAIALVFVPAAAVRREPRETEVIAADTATVDVPGQPPPVVWFERFAEVDGQEADDPAKDDFGWHLFKILIERGEVVREILDHGAGPGILPLARFQGRTIVVAGPDCGVGQHDKAIREAVVFEPTRKCHAVVGELCEVGGRRLGRELDVDDAQAKPPVIRRQMVDFSIGPNDPAPGTARCLNMKYVGAVFAELELALPEGTPVAQLGKPVGGNEFIADLVLGLEQERSRRGARKCGEQADLSERPLLALLVLRKVSPDNLVAEDAVELAEALALEGAALLREKSETRPLGVFLDRLVRDTGGLALIQVQPEAALALAPDVLRDDTLAEKVHRLTPGYRLSRGRWHGRRRVSR